jgi:hypothetical protein
VEVAQPRRARSLRRASRVIQITKQYLPLERDPLIPADQREVRPGGGGGEQKKQSLCFVVLASIAPARICSHALQGLHE